jgi:methylmalonyl-CoA/ethylmalonyl-CoA epimerase
MYEKIHHLGIAVRNLARTMHLFRDRLGFTFEKEIDWSSMGLKAAMFVVGENRLEFIEAINPKGELAESVAEFAATRDGMVHHLAFTVDDVEIEMQKLKSKGVRMLTGSPVETQGGKVLWLAKETNSGFLVELCSKNYRIT